MYREKNRVKVMIWSLFVGVMILMSIHFLWLIRPVSIAVLQGDDWIGVGKGVVRLKSDKEQVTQLNHYPIVYLEKGEYSLEEYLSQRGYKVTSYAPELMSCEYINEAGNNVVLNGHKCGAEYTIWKCE